MAHGSAGLVHELPLKQVPGHWVLQLVEDSTKDPGERRLEVTVLAGIGVQLIRAELTSLPSEIEGVAEQVASSQGSVQPGAQPLQIHVCLLVPVPGASPAAGSYA